MTINRHMYLTAALLAATADFLYLVVLRSLRSGAAGGDIPHTILVLIAASAAFMWILRSQEIGEEQNPVQAIWRVMVTVTLSLLLVGLLQLTSLLRFDTVDQVISPASYASLVASALLSMFIAFGAMLMFIRERDKKAIEHA